MHPTALRIRSHPRFDLDLRRQVPLKQTYVTRGSPSLTLPDVDSYDPRHIYGNDDAISRRSAILSGAAFLTIEHTLLSSAETAFASEETDEAITILKDVPGIGAASAQSGDILMFHYVGMIEPEGTVFDSTQGGLQYRDGGEGVYRPAVFKLGAYPQPGICQGLVDALTGMRVGGSRSVRVPPKLGFGNSQVLAPYAVVPGNATLRYDVSLVRLSRRGPDALLTGVSQCGGGFVMERSSGCRDISVAEYL